MGLWSAYFFVKLLLYARGDIDFNPWLNLAFAAFTALPPGNARQRFAKNLIAVPLGALLLYHDSTLPPLAGITVAYLANLLYHSINWPSCAAIIAFALAYALARRKLRLSTFVFIAIVWIAVAPATRLVGSSEAARRVEPAGLDGAPREAASRAEQIDPRSLQPDALDARLRQFYAAQSGEHVRFTRAPDDGVPYDIMILHVSSLSWADLQASRHGEDSLFNRFDVVFSHFNSAASYGAPAAIRLLRGNCGQTSEKQLYDPAPPECMAIDALQGAGFEPHWLINYDPRSDSALASVRRLGELPQAPEQIAGAAVEQRSAEGAPLYGDYSILSKWWARRATIHAARVVLYYNSLSLDDGNRRLGGGRAESSYAARLARFSADINAFLDDLQRSERHAIVLLIAEHGAALRGDAEQMAGLREIPTPAIAQVPVGVVLVNVARPAQWLRVRVDAPTSYLAVNEMLARFIADNPFEKTNLSLAPYTAALPQTEFVAENAGTTVMRVGRFCMVRSPDGSWQNLQE